MVFRGAQAMGLHPWHPDVQGRSWHQLLWSMLALTPGASERVAKNQASALSAQAFELVVWMESHVSRS